MKVADLRLVSSSKTKPRRNFALSRPTQRSAATRVCAKLPNRQGCDPLFSIRCALFLIHNSAYPHYFLWPAHSLQKTPGGGGLIPNFPPELSLTPIKSKRYAKTAPKPNKMKTMYDTPGVGGTPFILPIVGNRPTVTLSASFGPVTRTSRLPSLWNTRVHGSRATDERFTFSSGCGGVKIPCTHLH
jgi:hypothetical protein